MGRVSKHKKIKSCDPFYKGPRKNLVRKGDLPPPNDDDQPAPKSLLRLFKHKPKTVEDTAAEKTTRKQRKFRKAHPHSNETKRPISKNEVPPSEAPPEVELKQSEVSSESVTTGPPVKGRAAMFVRRPGETTKDYLERIDMESKMRIVDSLKKQKGKSTKRKKYLEERKKKAKMQKLQHKFEHTTKDFDELTDQVKFGEVVQAPPRLSAKPRGSSRKAPQSSRQLELHKKFPPALATPPQVPVVLGLKHKQDLEEERSKVITAYRRTKKAKQDRTD